MLSAVVKIGHRFGSSSLWELSSYLTVAFVDWEFLILRSSVYISILGKSDATRDPYSTKYDCRFVTAKVFRGPDFSLSGSKWFFSSVLSIILINCSVSCGTWCNMLLFLHDVIFSGATCVNFKNLGVPFIACPYRYCVIYTMKVIIS